MSSKKKGTRLERELFHLFWENSWVGLRTAGSGSTTLPAPDLLASNGSRVLAIECKAGKAEIRRYLREEQINELKEFSSKFGAEAWIGARFNGVKWLFLKLEDLGVSKKGTYYLDLELAREKGIGFEELVKK